MNKSYIVETIVFKVKKCDYRIKQIFDQVVDTNEIWEHRLAFNDYINGQLVLQYIIRVQL